MKEKQTQHLNELAADLLVEREFPLRTPHTYAHLGQVAVEYPDLPETELVFGPEA